MPIIIVESPNKVKKIAQLTGARVFATVGHFCDLPSNEMGVDMQTYDPHFIVNPEKMDRLEQIINACDGETVYLASDADREGYAIASLLHERIGQKADQCFRLEIREITEKGIKEAMDAAVPWENTNHKFYDSFLGRRVADRLSGYILSPLASSSLKGKFSVGRVQSPAVRIIVDREREIRNFKPETYFTISAKLSNGEKAFAANFVGYPENTDSFSSRDAAIAAITEASVAKYATVEAVEKKVATRGSKAPFTTVDLQAAASISLSIAPEKTMQLAQGLFEAGLITYHRTDSVRLSDEFIEEAAEFVSNNFGAEYLPKKPKSHSSKASQAEAHEGIRPTHLHPLDEIGNIIANNQLTDGHSKLYALIFKRAVSSIMADATFDSTSYKFDIGGLPFKASGSVPNFPGWMALYIEDTEDEKEAEQTLPDLAEGESVEKLSIDVEEKKTKAPGRYTEASLVKQLEKLGIGRPSTYAAIISRIKTAGYIAIEKKKLAATQSGEALIDYLNDQHSWIIDYSMTAKMEETLDDVAEGKADWKQFIKSLHEKMDFFVPEQRTPAEIKPPSEKQIELAQSIASKKEIKIPDAALKDSREMSKFLDKHMTKPAEPVGNCKCGGAVKEWDKSFQCQGCKATVWKEFMSKKLTKTQAVNLLNGKTIVLSGLKSQAGKEFDAKGRLTGSKIELIFDKK